MLLPQDEIHVWLAFDEQIPAPQSVREFTPWLEPGEIARMNRLPLASQRHQFLITRALQRSVLADYLQAAPEALRFTPGAHGKPALAAPFEDAGLHFNLAHTQGLVALAVSHVPMLGIDVENIAARTAPLALAARYFTSQEAAALRALPAADQPRRFYALWTLKESWLKATGRGLTAGLANASFDLDGCHRARSVTLTQEPDRDWRFWQAAPTPAQVLALATCNAKTAAVVRMRAWGEAGAREFAAPRLVVSGQEQRAQA